MYLSVNRIGVAADQSFFVSASSDRTAKVWQLSGLDKVAFPRFGCWFLCEISFLIPGVFYRSSVTYSGHNGRVMDVTTVENSHSVATCSDDGTVHVWRVDTAMPPANASAAVARGTGLSVAGAVSIRTLKEDSGPVVNIAHFNGSVASVLVYSSVVGGVHGWDLRAAADQFRLSIRPELGFPTALTLGPDRHWISVGTSLGFLCLWDIRFAGGGGGVMSNLFRHSSGETIHRLACCKAIGGLSSKAASATSPHQDGATTIFVAAGDNEAAVWRLPDAGECIKCCRSLSLSCLGGPVAALPSLIDVPIPSHPMTPISGALLKRYGDGHITTPSVRAIVGRVSASGLSHLITGGTDRQIRFWDFINPVKSFSVAGLDAGQSKPIYETALHESHRNMYEKLLLCYDADVPDPDNVVQTQRPLLEGRGPVPPGSSYKVVSAKHYIISYVSHFPHFRMRFWISSVWICL